MPFLLDTNQWIQLLKGRCPALARRLDQVAPEEVWLCSAVKEELFHGAWKHEHRVARVAKLEGLFARGTVRFPSMTQQRRRQVACATSSKHAAKSSARTTCKSPPSPAHVAGRW